MLIVCLFPVTVLLIVCLFPVTKIPLTMKLKGPGLEVAHHQGFRKTEAGLRHAWRGGLGQHGRT